MVGKGNFFPRSCKERVLSGKITGLKRLATAAVHYS
jgi:hypothetical protein